MNKKGAHFQKMGMLKKKLPKTCQSQYIKDHEKIVSHDRCYRSLKITREVVPYFSFFIYFWVFFKRGLKNLWNATRKILKKYCLVYKFCQKICFFGFTKWEVHPFVNTQVPTYLALKICCVTDPTKGDVSLEPAYSA